MDNSPTRKYQVFISSTYNDLQSHRREVVDAVLKLGHLPIGMELFSAASNSSWDIIKRHIDDSDYYVVILAHRYGSPYKGGNGIAYTEMEFEYAKSKGVPCLGFLIDESIPWSLNHTEQTANGLRRLKAFKQKLKDNQVDFWRDPTDLAKKVSDSLSTEINKGERSGWMKAIDLPTPAEVRNAEIQKQDADLLERAKGAISNSDLLQFLKWQYASEPILERSGYTYPVAVYPAPISQWEQVDSVLAPLNPHEPETYTINDSTFLDVVQRLKGFTQPNEIDSANYTMRHLRVEGTVTINSELGHYYSNYRTSEALEWEIRSNIQKLIGSNEDAFSNFSKQLFLRKKVHNSLHGTGSPVREGIGRSSAIGISTLIAYKESEDPNAPYQFLMRRRAKKGVPLRSGLLHVLPGFMFQPMTDVHREYSVTHNIYREYLEELFDNPEIHGGPDPNYFYADKRLLYLQQLINDKKAALYLTGVGVNLLNLRPEICTLLVIHTSEWYVKGQTDPEYRWKINKEFTNIGEGIAPLNEFVGSFSLSSDLNMIEKASIYPDRTVPAGAAAFWLGVDTLRELMRDSPPN